MEKFKKKYEVILGFATLVISLSAFKDELSKVNLDLGFTTLSLSEYFLYCVYGFSACLYFYIIEHIVRDTKIGHWKFFDYLIGFAFTIFVFTLISPLLIILDIFIINVYNLFTEKEKVSKGFIVFTLILNIISMIATIYGAKKLYDNRIKSLKEEAENEEIIALEASIKLNEEGYYAHSVLESFKVLEKYLYKRIIKIFLLLIVFKLQNKILLLLK